MSKRIFVGNLSFRTTEETLRGAFAPFGEVIEVKVMIDRDTGRPRGFAFVEMASEKAGQNAIAALDGTLLDDRQLRVSAAQERTAPDRGGGRDGGRRRGREMGGRSRR